MLVVYKLRCTNGNIPTYAACARGKHVSPGALAYFICTIASIVALLQSNIRPRVLCPQGLRAANEVQGTRGERAAVVYTGIPGKRIAYPVPQVTYWHTLRLHAASTYVLECRLGSTITSMIALPKATTLLLRLQSFIRPRCER